MFYFTPRQRFFSPFHHCTGSLSVIKEYLGLPDGPGRFRQGSTCPAVLRIPIGSKEDFVYRAITFYGQSFQTVLQSTQIPRYGPTTPTQSRFGLFRFRSPLLTESLICFLFLQVLRCFSSLGCSFKEYVLI